MAGIVLDVIVQVMATNDVAIAEVIAMKLLDDVQKSVWLLVNVILVI